MTTNNDHDYPALRIEWQAERDVYMRALPELHRFDYVFGFNSFPRFRHWLADRGLAVPEYSQEYLDARRKEFEAQATEDGKRNGYGPAAYLEEECFREFLDNYEDPFIPARYR